jgi:hypothetical protein
LVVNLARRGMRGKSRLFFRNAFHLPKVDRPSYFQTPVTLAKAQKNENEVAGTMPDESLTARISGGEAVPQPRDQRVEDNAFHRRRIFFCVSSAFKGRCFSGVFQAN